MSKRSLTLLLVSACNYQESVGSAAFDVDASVTEPSGGDSGIAGGADAMPPDAAISGAADAMPPDAGMSPHILSYADQCMALSTRGAELYCLSTEHEQAATDGSIRILIRRITHDEQIVTDGTLTSVYHSENTLAQDADHVYVSAEVTPATSYADASWSIFSFHKQTKTFTPVTSGWNEPPRHLQVIGENLYFFAREHVPVNTTYRYDRLYSVPSAGGSATLLTTSIASAAAVANDGTYVYAADFGRYEVTAVAIAPPHRVLTLVSTGLPWDSAACPPQALLVHGDWLYYGTQGYTSSIRRVPRPEPATTQETVSPVNEHIASNQHQTLAMTIAMTADDHSLYWTEWFEGLFRAPLDGSAPRQSLLSFGEQGNRLIAKQNGTLYFMARDPSTVLIAKYALSP